MQTVNIDVIAPEVINEYSGDTGESHRYSVLHGLVGQVLEARMTTGDR